MRILFDKAATHTTYRFADASYKQMVAATEIIQVATRARPSGYQYMPAYKRGQWDGYIRLCKSGRFPTGLLSLVINSLRENEFTDVTINHVGDAPKIVLTDLQPNMFSGITLRPYQLEAARLCFAYGRGVLKMATNSGKTEVMAAIVKLIPDACLILTTKKDLLHQTAARLENRLQESVGLVGDGCWAPQRVTVGMIQTLSRHLSKMKVAFDGLVCVMYDECHHMPSKSSQGVMFGLSAPLRFGFSGTPLRDDNLADLQLIGAAGPVLLEITNADLIEQGISAMPVIEMFELQGSDGDPYYASWQDAYNICIVGNERRNRIIANAVVMANAPATLILVERLEHGRLLQELMPLALFVHGSSSMESRAQALDALRAGWGAVVVATPIFDEGVDIPAVSLLILAGGGKGRIKLLQRIGRGMRQKNDNMLRVVDFVDDTNQYLLRHSMRRAEVYESEGFRVRIVSA